MKTCAAMAAAILILATLLSILPVHGEADIYGSVVRLHVLANSDSEGDQQNKLAVRDALLEVTSTALADCATRDEAVACLQGQLETLDAVAEETLRGLGCEDTVEVVLGQETYPTRAYEGFCFPSGSYLSLQVKIGEAAGQNWWCVLFPSLCLSAAAPERERELEEEFLAVGLTPEQYRVITESDEKTAYRLRFKFLEVLEQWRIEWGTR